MSKTEYIAVRDKYLSLIKSELLGPGSEISFPDMEHELISTSPDRRYSIGVLYTKYNKFKMDNNDTARVEADANIDEDFEEDRDGNGLNLEEQHRNDYIDEIAEEGNDEENLDEEVGLASQNMPSSMGFTFLVSNNIVTLNCNVEFATYRKAKVEDCRIPYKAIKAEDYTVPNVVEDIVYYDKSEGCIKLVRSISAKEIRDIKEKDILTGDDFEIISCLYKLYNQSRKGYVRQPHSLVVDIDFSNSDYVDNNKGLDGTNVKITALKRMLTKNLYSITVMMVNDDDRDSNGLRCIFQPKITIYSKDNDFTFQEYSKLVDFSYLDNEEKSLELQYRNKKTYSTGLGTSANWSIDSEGNGVIFTDYFPISEIPSMDFTIPAESNVDKKALSMKYLSDLNDIHRDEKTENLESIVNSYQEWIESQEKRSRELPNKYKPVANENIKGCRASLKRMKRGIQLLQERKDVWNAFSLANRAMFMQRVHLEIQTKTSYKDRYPDDDELSDILDELDYFEDYGFTDDKYYWRPFQIAFMLMSVESIIDDNSMDRNLVDLIWFPTGGGKTEAYLGLTAFSIFYRRLTKPKEAAGTTVIMRYTLRLLAAQQFTRASTLICACEYIREDAMSKRPKYRKYHLGKEEITIGLWIGDDHIPNTNAKAKSYLNKLNDATPKTLQYTKERYNKFQVLKCPWCGTKMVKDIVDNRVVGSFGYRMEQNKHFEMFCPQESCHFGQRDKLPIQIIDQELYKSPPTLLFGTVDKFAMIPWKSEIGNFFAVNSESRPPELVIQDELHLISGPLGTMVGLYESVIDLLCKEKGVVPKIVASTATIRRAKEQCAALYNRQVNQFPSPGLDAEDSFFAREATIDHNKEIYGRQYVGLMPSGKSKAMMQIRSIAALLQIIHTLQLPDEIKDKYWTLTVYFNSLKDLGKCSTLVEDDVKEYIRRIAFRLGDASNARKLGRADELTSRVTTTQLNTTLDKLEKVTFSQKNVEQKRYASNILLATNMISVGIDIARLNIMLLVGQPKLTSEYIQASSRIGRSYPGVALTIYDSTKSRDRSHFEQFKQYHESYYKYVEPTGVTPFSKPARDRALHAVIIAMMRLLEPELTLEEYASKFNREQYSNEISKIKDYLINREREVTKRMNSSMREDADEMSFELDYIFEKWEHLAETYKEGFSYGEKFMFSLPGEGEGRLLKPFNTSQHDPAFDTMTSMRNVDASAGSNILIWEEE